MTRINSAAELQTLRKRIQSKRDPKKPCIAICAGTGCFGPGSDRVISAFEEEVKKRSLKAKVDIRATGCHGVPAVD